MYVCIYMYVWDRVFTRVRISNTVTSKWEPPRLNVRLMLIIGSLVRDKSSVGSHKKEKLGAAYETLDMCIACVMYTYIHSWRKYSCHSILNTYIHTYLRGVESQSALDPALCEKVIHTSITKEDLCYCDMTMITDGWRYRNFSSASSTLGLRVRALEDIHILSSTHPNTYISIPTVTKISTWGHW